MNGTTGTTGTSASMTDLVREIQESTATITKYLDENALPTPSLAPDSFPFFPGSGPVGVDPFPRLNQDVVTARNRARDACGELMQLISGPSEAFFWAMVAHHASATLQYVYHFRVADAVPVEGDISYKDLAAKCGVLETQCARCVKFLAVWANIFRPTRPGYVGHTSLSRMLLIPDFRDVVGYLLEESFVGAPRLSEAAETLPGSQERNTTPWNLGHGTDLPLFEFFEGHPARLERFVGAMRQLASGGAWDLSVLTEGFDWKSLGKGVVVDVGGSYGHCCTAIAGVAPDLNFIVQDLQRVVEQVERERAADNKASDHMTFQAHDFFTPQPVKDADVYLLRFICHDYSDKYAAKILKSVSGSMGPRSRIVIVDTVMPEAGVLHRDDELRLRLLDMEMMLSYNGLERDEVGWQRLFEQADPRLKLMSTKKIPGHSHALMVLGLQEAN